MENYSWVGGLFSSAGYNEGQVLQDPHRRSLNTHRSTPFEGLLPATRVNGSLKSARQ